MEDICIVSELFVVGIIARFMFQKNGRNGPDLIREWKRDLEPRFLHANYYELWLKIWLISIKASAALISGQKKIRPAVKKKKKEKPFSFSFYNNDNNNRNKATFFVISQTFNVCFQTHKNRLSWFNPEE